MAWTITLDFDDGGGARDITTYVNEESFKRSRTLWNELQPTIDYLKFDMNWYETIVKLFLGLDGAEVAVVVQEDAVDYFTGYVRTNWNFSLTTRPQSFKVECVDPGILLKEKIVKPDTPALWENYTVYNSGDSTSSILSKLMIGAGFTHADIDADSVGDTIDYFPYVEDGRNYFDTMATLLYEHHRTFYFDEYGNMKLFDWSPASISTGDTFDNDNMVGELRLQKLPEKYQQVSVRYWEHKTLTDEIVFEETTNQNQTYKCSITLEAGEFYPKGGDSRNVYADYRVDGQDLIAVKGAYTDTVMGDSVSENTFTSYFTKALMQYENNAGTAEYIYKLDVVGDAIVKGDLIIKERDNVTGTDKKLKYECRHLYTALTAARMVRGLASYYRYADFTYLLTSGDSIPLGEYVSIAETSWLDINNVCVVQGREDNEFTSKSVYRLEGIAEYNAGDTIGDVGGVYTSPFPTQSRDYIIVGASNYAGDADYFCDGTSDETEINTAITYANANSVGEVHLAGGEFIIDDEVSMLSGVILNLNGCTITRNAAEATDYAIDMTPASGTATNMTLLNGIVQSGDSDSSTNPLIYISDADNVLIRSVDILDSTGEGIYIYSTDENVGNISVERCTIRDCAEAGIYIRPDIHHESAIRILNNTISGCDYGVNTLYATTTISNNQITDCKRGGIFVNTSDDSVITNNFVMESGYYRETAVRSGIYVYDSASDDNLVVGNVARRNGNLINNYACEHSTNEPQLDGNVLTNITAARSAVQAYEGTYSYLITKDVAAGTGAQFEMTDNTNTTDQHGLQDAYIYRLGMRIYIPSGGIQASEVTIYISDYQASWEHSTQAAAAVYDAWQYVEVTRTMRAAPTGCLVRLYFSSTAADTEYVYIDDVRLVSMTSSNTAHSNQFTDAGTGTKIHGNSWQ